jgi:CheY-like chemotaxis protein
MIIDKRSGPSVVVVRKVDGLISAAWSLPANQDTSQLDVREVEGAASTWRSGLPKSACSAAPPRVVTDTGRILIVDDDVESAELLAMLLNATGRGETQLTRLGSAAVSLAVEFSATIAFIDLKLPDMSSYEVARRLHQHPLLRKLRLIALTDSDEQPDREFARVAGFERYLVKPVTRTGVEELPAA